MRSDGWEKEGKVRESKRRKLEQELLGVKWDRNVRNFDKQCILVYTAVYSFSESYGKKVKILIIT